MFYTLYLTILNRFLPFFTVNPASSTVKIPIYSGPAADDSWILLVQWLRVYVHVYYVYTRVLVAVQLYQRLCVVYDWLESDHDIVPNILLHYSIKVSAYCI